MRRDGTGTGRLSRGGIANTLGEAWRRTHDAAPRALALVDPVLGPVTRAGVLEATSHWVGRLATQVALESVRQRKVALVAGNGLGWFAAFLGLLEVGAVPVLLDKGEREEVLRDTACGLGASWLWLQDRLQALPLRARLRRKDLCLVKVTSGSTGRPRGMEFTQAQMLADGRQVCASMGIGPGDINLGVIPLGHSYGLGNLVVPLLEQGTALVCADSPLPSVLAELCSIWRPTVFPAVPTLIRALARADLPSGALASLRTVITAGARIDPADAAAFESKHRRAVHNFYGSSETGGICYDPTGEVAVTGRSVGRPMAGVSLEALRGGRFRVRSAAVMGGGLFSPADLGSLDARGELVLAGRVGRAVKIGGRRLDLAGLEAEIASLPGVRSAVVAPHPSRAESLAALVACDDTIPGLRARLSGRFAAWKLPERLRVVAEMPLTARGKTDRRRALELLAD